jgi:hypothetical protein
LKNPCMFHNLTFRIFCEIEVWGYGLFLSEISCCKIFDK